MSPPKRQSVSRRGFLAAMAAVSAAGGAFALSARGASAASGSAAATGAPLGSAARAASQYADDVAPAAHTIGEDAILDRMTSARRQDTAIRPFVVEVPDADIDDLRHFIHVRSQEPNALPLIVTHGWPGSVVEQLNIIDPLTNPTAHGGRHLASRVHLEHLDHTRRSRQAAAHSGPRGLGRRRGARPRGNVEFRRRRGLRTDGLLA